MMKSDEGSSEGLFNIKRRNVMYKLQLPNWPTKEKSISIFLVVFFFLNFSSNDHCCYDLRIIKDEEDSPSGRIKSKAACFLFHLSSDLPLSALDFIR
jgi:hypothetical protein